MYRQVFCGDGKRLETRGLLERSPCPEDSRATNARLTDAGWQKMQDSAPLGVRPCSLAAALDILGERWSLLALREIGYGVHRFAHHCGRPVTHDTIHTELAGT